MCYIKNILLSNPLAISCLLGLYFKRITVNASPVLFYKLRDELKFCSLVINRRPQILLSLNPEYHDDDLNIKIMMTFYALKVFKMFNMYHFYPSKCN